MGETIVLRFFSFRFVSFTTVPQESNTIGFLYVGYGRAFAGMAGMILLLRRQKRRREFRGRRSKQTMILNITNDERSHGKLKDRASTTGRQRQYYATA